MSRLAPLCCCYAPLRAARSDRIEDEALPGMLELNSTGVEGGLGRNNGTGRQVDLAGGADWSPPLDTPVRSVGRWACPVGDVGHRLPFLM